VGKIRGGRVAGLINKSSGNKKKEARILTAKELTRLERRQRPRYIPRDIQRMVDANCARTAVCYKCGGVSERVIDLLPDKNIVTVDYSCKRCGWSKRSKTMLYPKKVREMVSNTSSIGIKTWKGIRFICPECNSSRVKLIIEPEYISESTVTINYKCRSCGWGSLYTLSIVKE